MNTKLLMATALTLIMALDLTIGMAPALASNPRTQAATAPKKSVVPSVLNYGCQTKAPGQFNSLNEFTCAYDLFVASSIALAEPKKMDEFVKLWTPEIWAKSDLLKMDGVSQDQRIVNTFTLISRMRDFTHERFDFVDTPAQSAAIQKGIVHPELQGGIGASVELTNMADIRAQIWGSAPKKDMTEEIFKALQAKMEQASVIGPDHQLTVDSPVQDGPSWGSLRSGDVITGVDSILSFDGMQEKHVVEDLLRGSPGTTLMLHVKRRTARGVVLNLNFQLVRDVVAIHTVSSHDVNGVRHITIHDYSNDFVVDDYFQAVSEAKEKGMKGIVVNLKGNPGGRLDYTIAMLEMVVQRGQILTTRFRDQGSVSSTQTDYVVEDGYVLMAKKAVGAPNSSQQFESNARVAYTPDYGKKIRLNPQFVYEHPLLPVIGEDMPMVVEINVDSYSASEVYAGAIQATHRGKIVGQPSAGKGAIMNNPHLPEGGGLMITSGQFYPGGEDTKLKGIVPDRLVNDSEDYGKTDPQGDAANAVIEEEYAQLQARKALTVERIKINSARFEEEMKTRDDFDQKPPVDVAAAKLSAAAKAKEKK